MYSMPPFICTSQVIGILCMRTVLDPNPAVGVHIAHFSSFGAMSDSFLLNYHRASFILFESGLINDLASNRQSSFLHLPNDFIGKVVRHARPLLAV